jgi:O-antigen ligase
VNTLRGPTQWFLAYLVFCMVSSIWAGNLTYVVYRAVELIAVLFFMAYVLDTVGDPVEAIRYLCRFSALTALLPYLAMAVRNGGIFQHTNSFSTSGAFGAALALASIRRGVLRLGDVKWSLTACLAAVVLGTSSASNISLIIGVLMIVAASRGRAVSVTRLVLISTVAFLVLTVGFEVVRPYLFPGETTEHIRSLRGRTTLYQGFWDAFQEHPFLGYGFASGEKSTRSRRRVISTRRTTLFCQSQSIPDRRLTLFLQASIAFIHYISGGCPRYNVAYRSWWPWCGG